MNTIIVTKPCQPSSRIDTPHGKKNANRDEVVSYVEFHARVFEGFETALVRGQFGRVRLVWTEQTAKHLGNYADTDADEQE
eukprot:gene34595-42675_t